MHRVLSIRHSTVADFSTMGQISRTAAMKLMEEILANLHRTEGSTFRMNMLTELMKALMGMRKRKIHKIGENTLQDKEISMNYIRITI